MRVQFYESLYLFKQICPYMDISSGNIPAFLCLGYWKPLDWWRAHSLHRSTKFGKRYYNSSSRRRSPSTIFYNYALLGKVGHLTGGRRTHRFFTIACKWSLAANAFSPFWLFVYPCYLSTRIVPFFQKDGAGKRFIACSIRSPYLSISKCQDVRFNAASRSGFYAVLQSVI